MLPRIGLTNAATETRDRRAARYTNSAVNPSSPIFVPSRLAPRWLARKLGVWM
jgi:hypothetical protein